MKKNLIFLTLLAIGTFVLINISCEKEPEESCKQDDLCEGKDVTVCCASENDCVYKFDGKELPANTSADLDSAAVALGCVAIDLKSTVAKQELANVRMRLQLLRDAARAGLKE